jgi:hypothetical protein
MMAASWAGCLFIDFVHPPEQQTAMKKIYIYVLSDSVLFNFILFQYIINIIFENVWLTEKSSYYCGIINFDGVVRIPCCHTERSEGSPNIIMQDEILPFAQNDKSLIQTFYELVNFKLLIFFNTVNDKIHDKIPDISRE